LFKTAPFIGSQKRKLTNLNTAILSTEVTLTT